MELFLYNPDYKLLLKYCIVTYLYIIVVNNNINSIQDMTRMIKIYGQKIKQQTVTLTKYPPVSSYNKITFINFSPRVFSSSLCRIQHKKFFGPYKIIKQRSRPFEPGAFI